MSCDIVKRIFVTILSCDMICCNSYIPCFCDWLLEVILVVELLIIEYILTNTCMFWFYRKPQFDKIPIRSCPRDTKIPSSSLLILPSSVIYDLYTWRIAKKQFRAPEKGRISFWDTSNFFHICKKIPISYTLSPSWNY